MAPRGSADATVLARWLRLALDAVETNASLINSFNVFPVPDSDTGTNVTLTLRGAVRALDDVLNEHDCVHVMSAAADGAIRSARGNSGLLVSQSLGAMASTLAQAPSSTSVRVVDLLASLDTMAASTWAAVSHPVDGTLLTVASAAAESARSWVSSLGASNPPTVASTAQAAALGAQEAVVETAGLGHGPVDAGAAALMLVLTSLSDACLPEGSEDGHLTDVAVQMLHDLASDAIAHGRGSHGQRHTRDVRTSTGEFEVMYLLEATAEQAQRVRDDLERIGDSVGVVGTPDPLGVGLFHVHVHTNTPRAALPRNGQARQICIHHLRPTPSYSITDDPPYFGRASHDGHVVSLEQMAARRRRRDAQRRHPSQQGHQGERRPSALHAGQAVADDYNHSEVPTQLGVGVIACTRAPGLIEPLARTGAVVVLNPDMSGIVRAAGDLGVRHIAVLPCDADSATAAHEAARRFAARAASYVRRPRSHGPDSSPAESTSGVDASRHTRHIMVTDTDDDARVLAAAVAIAGHVSSAERMGADAGSLTDVAHTATLAASHLRTLALNGEQTEPRALSETIAAHLRPDDELVTVILGADAPEELAGIVRDAVAAGMAYYDVNAGFDAIDVVIHAGGQTRPDVLIAFE